MSSFLDRITGRDKTQIPLYEDDGLESLEDGQWQSQDWVTYTGRNYGLAVLSSPFQLTETLLQVQYRGDPSLLNKATGNKAEAGSAATLAAQETPAAEAPAPAPVQSTEDGSDGYLPSLNAGILKPIRQILEYEHFGYLSLLRGHLSTFLHLMAEQILQPNLEELLLDFFDVFEDTDPGINIFSNMLVGGLLSPLELARTRLIVQATHTKKSKYIGLFHCLATIANEEGGILGLYSFRHFLPSLAFHALRPALRLVSNYVISDTLNINTTFNPISYRLCQAALLAVETAFLAPLELARKRLQAQIYPHKKRRLIPVTPNIEAQEKQADPRYPTVIAVSPQPYTGVLDVFLRVTREEGGQRSDGYVDSVRAFWVGYTSLYRGFWPMFTTGLLRMSFEEAEKVNTEYAFI